MFKIKSRTQRPPDLSNLATSLQDRFKMLKFDSIVSQIPSDFVEISHLTYRELYELKVVAQPVKIKHKSDPFETQMYRCE